MANLLLCEDRGNAALLERSGKQRLNLTGISSGHRTQTGGDWVIRKLIETKERNEGTRQEGEGKEEGVTVGS